MLDELRAAGVATEAFGSFSRSAPTGFEHGRLLRNATDAEDAAQQTFLSAFASLIDGTVPGNAAAWLATIARRECWSRTAQRRRQPLQLDDTDAGSQTSSALDEAIRNADLAALWQAINALPRQQRAAFLLREILGPLLHRGGGGARSERVRGRNTSRARPPATPRRPTAGVQNGEPHRHDAPAAAPQARSPSRSGPGRRNRRQSRSDLRHDQARRSRDGRPSRRRRFRRRRYPRARPPLPRRCSLACRPAGRSPGRPRAARREAPSRRPDPNRPALAESGSSGRVARRRQYRRASTSHEPETTGSATDGSSGGSETTSDGWTASTSDGQPQTASTGSTDTSADTSQPTAPSSGEAPAGDTTPTDTASVTDTTPTEPTQESSIENPAESSAAP